MTKPYKHQPTPKPLTEKEFVVQYVLARATARPDNLEPTAAAQAASKAWRWIQENCK